MNIYRVYIQATKKMFTFSCIIIADSKSQASEMVLQRHLGSRIVTVEHIGYALEHLTPQYIGKGE